MIDYFNKINIVSGCKTISIDITDLYTCTPKIEALKTLKTHNNNFNNKETNEIMYSISSVINHNYFEYKKTCFSKMMILLWIDF